MTRVRRSLRSRLGSVCAQSALRATPLVRGREGTGGHRVYELDTHGSAPPFASRTGRRRAVRPPPPPGGVSTPSDRSVLTRAVGLSPRNLHPSGRASASARFSATLCVPRVGGRVICAPLSRRLCFTRVSCNEVARRLRATSAGVTPGALMKRVFSD